MNETRNSLDHNSQYGIAKDNPWQSYVNISKLLQITVSLRTEIVFVFTWDFDEVLKLPPNFVSVYQTEPKFKTNSNFASVCHVNRHIRGTSK